MEPSGMASTSAYLASMTAGQKTTSKCRSTSRRASWTLRMAMSQPPQAPAQYIASAVPGSRSALDAANRRRPVDLRGASVADAHRRPVPDAWSELDPRLVHRRARAIPGPHGSAARRGQPSGPSARTSSTIRVEGSRRAAGPRRRWPRPAGAAAGSMPSAGHDPAQQQEAAQRLRVLDPVVAVPGQQPVMTTPSAPPRTPSGRRSGSRRPEHMSRIRRTLGGYLMRAVPARSAAR